MKEEGWATGGVSPPAPFKDQNLFKELLDNPDRITAGELQASAQGRFPEMVQNSSLSLRRIGDEMAADKIVAIIGIATWSPLELQLLDEINDSYPMWSGSREVFVFDLAACKDYADAVAHLSHPPNSIATPMLIIRKDREIIGSSVGIPSRMLLGEHGFLE